MSNIKQLNKATNEVLTILENIKPEFQNKYPDICNLEYPGFELEWFGLKRKRFCVRVFGKGYGIYSGLYDPEIYMGDIHGRSPIGKELFIIINENLEKTYAESEQSIKRI